MRVVYTLVVATLAAGCILSLFERTHVHWIPIFLAFGVIGGLVTSAER